jgi:peptidoglycan/LPS O-acetylase OafA/YrhL
VLLVLGYHLFPGRVSGGYVGVDVFFVISGYLITAHLYREVRAHDSVSLAGFWARRARRLLPAALLVLAFCVVLTATVIPRTQWDQTVRQIIASALYWQNWALAGDAVDYSARGNVPTLVQHYWSLSVEEQFYLVWPVLILLVLLAGRRRGPLARRRALVGTVSLLGLASFACSIVLTPRSHSAYFLTQTRAWEFAVGALLALVGTGWLSGARTRVLLGWSGVVAVLGAGFVLDDQTPFPGAIALVPVLGTAAVIAAGKATSPLSAAHWLGLRPARFVGDISYSVYLWHWPLIVSLPYLTGVPLRTADKPGILVATLLVSWVCTRFVEDPVRRRAGLVKVPWRAFAASAVAMALVVGSAHLLQVSLDRQVATAHARTARALAGMSVTGCEGPPALDPSQHCDSPQGSGPLLSSPAVVAQENADRPFARCEATELETRILSCELGDTTAPLRSVAIVGDSHATMWLPALDRIGRLAHWRVVTYSRSSCPFTGARRTLKKLESVITQQSVCVQKDAEVLHRILADDSIDTVFVTAYSSAYGWTTSRRESADDAAIAGFHHIWKPIVQAGKQVVVLRDVPAVKDRVNTPDCLVKNPGNPMACANPRRIGLVQDVEALAAQRGAPPGVRLIDLTKQYCDAQWCYAVVGNVIVYRDYSHLSREYSLLMTPYLLRAFNRVDRTGGG